MGIVAGVIIAGVAGAGASVYGANKQASAQDSANAANAAAVAANNQQQWNNYLLERGIQGNNAPTGTVPADASAVNAKLPLWANVNISNGIPNGATRWAKSGTPTPATNFTMSSQPGTAAPSTVTGTQSSSALSSYG